MALVTMYWYLDGDDWDVRELSRKIQSAGSYSEMADSRDRLVALLKAEGYDVTLTNRKRNITAVKDGDTRTYKIGRVQVPSSML